MDKKDFLWGMYQEHVAHGRQHEDQRERMTGAVAALAAAVLALYSSDNDPIRISPFIAGWLLVVIGAYGTIFSLKHYERFRRHATFAGLYRNQLETLLADLPVPGGDIRDEGDRRHLGRRLFRLLSRFRLHWLWAGLPLMIAVGGVMLLARR